MRVLGISAFEQDASAALVADGQVVAAAAEERFTRQKHDPSFPRFAVEYCLDQAGAKACELDAVVFYEEPQSRFTRVLTTTMAGFPQSWPLFVGNMKTWLSRLWTRNELSKKLDVHPALVSFVSHGQSHAAQAFCTSPFDEAAVLIVDTAGEWASTALYSASRANGLTLQEYERIDYPHSLGLVQQAFAVYLGFRVPGWEAGISDLAAFGRPTYVDQLRKLISIREDGSYRVDPSYFRFDRLNQAPFDRPFTPALTALLGPARDARVALQFDTLKPASGSATDTESQRLADIAASFQVVLEEAVLGLCKRIHQVSGSSALCLAGAVATNPSVVGRILQEGPFEHLYLPPEPGEGGGALGAAMHVGAFESKTGATSAPYSPFVGKEYDESRDAAAIRHADPKYWVRFLKHGCKQPDGMTLDVRTHENPDELIACIVDDLQAGKVVGWFQGRFAFSPSGLGRRSILADPSNQAAVQRLRDEVVGQPAFRPFGLAIAEEDAAKVVDVKDHTAWPLRWMQAAVPVAEEAAGAVSAAVHVNATIRPLICGDDSATHALLKAWGARSGLAALVCADFNEYNYPIVGSPADALIVFARTEMETVVINNLVVRKVQP